MYPVMLNLRDKRCLVIGGGGVALRKVEGLLADGAVVDVVAREPHQALRELAQAKTISLAERAYARDDIAGHVLVFAATDDNRVNRAVFDDAEAAGIWVNVADVPEICSFHLPARVRRGHFQLAIASAGEAPFVVRRLRQLLERRFGQEWAEWIEAAARFRTEVRALNLDSAASERRYDRFFAATVDEPGLHARVPTADEEKTWLAGEKGKVSADAVQSVVDHSAAPVPSTMVGLVSLVGAGPGDPGLLTVRALRRLHAAQVIVYDRLAESALPPDLDASVELHTVGKEAGRHPVPQEEINALLVRLGREGKRVVRLKGGDPYVFGRGGEEAEDLARAGVPFEVVPGVTSGVVVPAYAGIPVTHRADASRLAMVTAHESAKEGGSQVRWDLLAQDAHTTIVGYMGVSALPRVAEKLIAGGMDPQTPAALIERGTTSSQRSVVSTLRDLHADVEKAGLQPPALFVIGQAVRHAPDLNWFASRPLFGQRIAVLPGARAQVDMLELAGAEVLELPLPVTPVARILLAAQPLAGVVFSNPDEVEALEDERGNAGFTASTTAWCLDVATEKRARERRWGRVRAGVPDVGD
ncbi:MAG: siroheme synthase CysG [Pseudomonadota bacterium]